MFLEAFWKKGVLRSFPPFIHWFNKVFVTSENDSNGLPSDCKLDRTSDDELVLPLIE